MARRLKIRHHGPQSKYDLPEIKRRIQTGESYKSISADTGCHPTWVSRIGLKMGIVKKARK